MDFGIVTCPLLVKFVAMSITCGFPDAILALTSGAASR